MSARRRIAVVSHGHPEISTGGGERASYALFNGLKQHPDIEPIYVARAPAAALGHSGDFASFRGRQDEILWSPPPIDSFRMASQEPDRLKRQALELFSALSVDLVHLHHYVYFGVDLVRIVRRDMGVPVVLTLHEYLAICNHHGQMIKTNGRLCHASSYSECSACFPERSSGKFFLRKAMILDDFAHVDLFVSPSRFLAGRYSDWGIAADKIRVIENPLQVYGNSAEAGPRQPAAKASDGTLRLGYFGQLNPFKGLDVLLDAIEMIDETTRARIKLNLFGANMEIQPGAFQKRIAAKLQDLQAYVIDQGAYRNEDVLDLMRAIDWVVVPSVWWENSPVVIQEAKAAGVPVLCSNIGGMKEKVRPGIDGAHFIVGNRADLADKIVAIADGRITAAGGEAPASETALQEIVEAYMGVWRPDPCHGPSSIGGEPR